MRRAERFSLLRYFRKVEERLAPAWGFKAGTMEEWKRWREGLRRELWRLLGDLPEETSSLNPEVVEEFEKDGILISKIVYDVEEDFSIPAYLLRPAEAKGRLPAILALHGHGRGKVDVAGIFSSELEYQKHIAPLNYDYAYQFAKRGYVVLAPDARCFGELSRDGVRCDWGFKAAILLGRTLVGLRVWDAMRSIDYLQSLPFVDGSRIGCVGLSWGGTWTAYTSALDDRIKVAVISGYFDSFRDMLLERPCCICQYIPGIRKIADFPDIVGLIAPRPLLIEYGRRDPLYTYSEVLKAYGRLKKIYELLGVPERLDLDVFDGAHMFHGGKAYVWVDKWLKINGS